MGVHFVTLLVGRNSSSRKGIQLLSTLQGLSKLPRGKTDFENCKALNNMRKYLEHIINVF
jgi:hypothetical protein